MKNPLILLFLFLFSTAKSQYFFKDIIGTVETNTLMKSFIDNNVKKVSSAYFDADGAPTKNYSEEQEVNENSKLLKITTINDRNISIISYRFDSQDRLIFSVDLSNGLKSTTNYTYDKDGLLTVISNSIIDSLQDFTQTEVHQWFYKRDTPVKMWRIINTLDTLEVRFKTDENGNVIEEQNFKHGKGDDPILYYYDNKKRLTDIVRYNYKAKKLLPDYLFEYDDKNHVIQKITTLSNFNLGYLTWRYLYNDKGLKIKEALFNKEKKLQGRIEFNYF